MRAQVSHYDSSGADVRIEDSSAMRKRFGLPSDNNIVMFCNFNKIDKFEPQSFALWMNLLRRVPKSVLWLLQPDLGHEHIIGQLREEAALHVRL
jgi:predicted O-linked N-acetylglucosamine transferase (SPINDLY family)